MRSLHYALPIYAGQTLARLGGDEFIVLAPDLGGVDDGRRLAERLLATLREPFEMADPELFVSCSIGIAVSPVHGCTYESRSDEQTSELQSLMRNSYAVFCLKKTTNTRK